MRELARVGALCLDVELGEWVGIDLAKRRLDSSMILWRVSSMKIRGIANAKRVEERTLIRADHQIKPGLVPYCLPISANSSVRPS